MHDSAMQFAKQFFDLYVENKSDVKIVDIGAQDVNGSLRSVAPRNCQYMGVDFSAAKASISSWTIHIRCHSKMVRSTCACVRHV